MRSTKTIVKRMGGLIIKTITEINFSPIKVIALASLLLEVKTNQGRIFLYNRVFGLGVIGDEPQPLCRVIR